MPVVPVVLWIVSVVAAPGLQERAGSLEALLAKVRAERELEHERMRPRVAELVKRLESARFAEEKERIQTAFDELGPEVAPLLVPYLDPGSEPGEGTLERSREVARALSRLGTVAIVDALAELARTGNPPTRERAVSVLAYSPDTERANHIVREIHAGASGALEAESIRALARLGGNDEVVVAALADPDVAVVRAGLAALTETASAAGAPGVRALLAAPERADPVLLETLAYLRAVPSAVDQATVRALIACVASELVAPERRVAALDALPRLGFALGQEERRAIEPLTDSADAALRESALIALTLLKDAKARRELLRYYDRIVDENDKWPQAYKRRADVYMRIGDYPDAIKDYRSALGYLGGSARLATNRDVWIALARAYVLDGKLAQAADRLQEFGMTPELKQELGNDPDFAPLKKRYKELFE